MGETSTASEFATRFKDRLNGLFSDVTENRQNINLCLWEMVEFIAPGITMPEHLREDAKHEAWVAAVALIRKAIPVGNRAAWYRTCINRKLWEFMDAHAKQSVPLTENSIQQVITPVLSPIDRATRAATRKRLKPPSAAEIRIVRHWIDSKIARTVQAMESAETEQWPYLIGTLHTLQEERLHFFKAFKPCETRTVRFTKERRIEKE